MSIEPVFSPIASQRLSEVELELLDGMLARCPDACSLEELDGLICALVTAPVDVPASDWLPAAMGAEVPEWATPDEAQRMIGLLMRHWNTVRDGFREDWSDVDDEDGPDRLYFPMLDEPKHSGHPLAEGWARGFRAGLDWLEDAHIDALEEDDECLALVSLVAAFDSGEKKMGETFTHEEREKMLPGMVASLQYLYGFWQRYRRVVDAPRVPFRAENMPGRNDVCFCGSGKKYKKCCGAVTLH